MGRYMMRFINATAFIRRISIKKVIAWAVILVCALIGFLIYKSDIGVTYVFCDSVQHKVMSFSEKTPEEIVAKAGITLDSENSLVLDYYKPEEGEKIIIVAEPHNVVIYDEGKQVASVNVAGTVKSALDKAGLSEMTITVPIQKSPEISCCPVTPREIRRSPILSIRQYGKNGCSTNRKAGERP